MRAVVRKWGNSASVRIPAAIMEAAHLQLDMPVDIREDRGRIVIVPLCKSEYKLDDLLAGITTENLHEPVDFGDPIGTELL